MKRLFFLVVLIASQIFASDIGRREPIAVTDGWDAKQGGIAIRTEKQDNREITKQLGVYGMMPWVFTWVWVSCDNPNVNEIEVALTYLNNGKQIVTESKSAKVTPGKQWTPTVFMIDPAQIVSGPSVTTRIVQIVELETFKALR